MEKVLSEVGGLMPHFHCIAKENDIFRIIQGEAMRQPDEAMMWAAQDMSKKTCSRVRFLIQASVRSHSWHYCH